MRRLSNLFMLVGLTACSGGTPFPGGALEGTPTPVPASWAAPPLPDVIELETHPADPYSVHLWIIGMGDHAYVHAGANRAAWVEHIEADANVRLQVEKAVYELKAERVASADEFAAFSEVYEDKYGNRPRNENVNEAYLFKLTAR